MAFSVVSCGVMAVESTSSMKEPYSNAASSFLVACWWLRNINIATSSAHPPLILPVLLPRPRNGAFFCMRRASACVICLALQEMALGGPLPLSRALGRATWGESTVCRHMRTKLTNGQGAGFGAHGAWKHRYIFDLQSPPRSKKSTLFTR